MKPLPPEMLQQIEALTREAMGFPLHVGILSTLLIHCLPMRLQLKHLRYLKAHNLCSVTGLRKNTAYCHYCLVYVAFRYQTSMG